MSALNLLAVFAENKPGQTAAITKIIADANVNLHWVTIANSGNFGVMKLLVDKPELALKALRDKGLMVATLAVTAVEVDNRAGQLYRVAEILAGKNINLVNCSGFVTNSRAVLVIESQEAPQASEALKAAGLKVLSQDEMLRL